MTRDSQVSAPAGSSCTRKGALVRVIDRKRGTEVEVLHAVFAGRRVSLDHEAWRHPRNADRAPLWRRAIRSPVMKWSSRVKASRLSHAIVAVHLRIVDNRSGPPRAALIRHATAD